jgi:hypothetical protein
MLGPSIGCTEPDVVKDLRRRSCSITIGVRDHAYAAIIPLPTELSRSVEHNTQASFIAAAAS